MKFISSKAAFCNGDVAGTCGNNSYDAVVWQVG